MEGRNSAIRARPMESHFVPVQARNFASIERGQQFGVVVRNQVDEVLVKRLLGSVGVGGVAQPPVAASALRLRRVT